MSNILENIKNENKEWDYIQYCLKSQDMTIDDLKDIFQVTSTTINKWKKGEPLSREKHVFLAKLFKVTLDQYYKREIPDEYYHEKFYNFNEILKPKNYKGLTDRKLKLLFDTEKRLKTFIELELNNEDPTEIMNIEEFDYVCYHYKVSCSYEMNSEGLKTLTKYLDYQSLLDIKSQLIESWNTRNVSERFHYEIIDLFEILLRSENIKFINSTIYNDVWNGEYHNITSYPKVNELMEKYVKLKNSYKEFDISCDVLNTLIAEYICFIKNGEKDFERTFNYQQKIIRKENYDKFIEEK